MFSKYHPGRTPRTIGSRLENTARDSSTGADDRFSPKFPQEDDPSPLEKQRERFVQTAIDRLGGRSGGRVFRCPQRKDTTFRVECNRWLNCGVGCGVFASKRRPLEAWQTPVLVLAINLSSLNSAWSWRLYNRRGRLVVSILKFLLHDLQYCNSFSDVF